MINVTIKVDTSRLDRAMADFPVRVAQVKTRILAYAGQAVASRSTQAFRTASFRPSPWAPRKNPGDRHPLLIRSGNLRHSISWKFLNDRAVVVGSNQKYSLYHQHGTRRMPARPFFPIDAGGRLMPDMARKIAREAARISLDEMKKL